MLFDLQGKRRRLIQATYLTLAILMGGGLVFFGIGSDVQGGLADFFTGSDSSDANPALEDQLEQAEEALAANPDDPEALAEVARANYQLAVTTDEEARAVGAIFAEDATPRLEAAADAWNRYLEANQGRPDASLALLMVRVFGEQGLNDPAEAAEAAEIVAEEQRDLQSYLLYTQYAALAGDDRQAELAGQRAAQEAPAAQRDQVERQVDALIRAADQLRSQNQAPPQGGSGAVPPGGVPLPEDGAAPPGGVPLPEDGQVLPPPGGGGGGSGGGGGG
jgi:ribosomal protein L9